MASDIDICNAALGHLGVSTRVVSIDPPDASVEADRCAMFYPMARRALLEATRPTWAKRRATLTPLAANPSSVWGAAYERPSDCVLPLRVFPASQSVLAAAAAQLNSTNYAIDPVLAALASLDESSSAPFEAEAQTIFTHEPEAVLLYIADDEVVARATPNWVIALGYMLASLMAGGTLKGRPGAQTARAFNELALTWANKAAALEANGGHQQHNVVAPWLAGRR